MRLSEAIRLGAMLGPQAFGAFHTLLHGVVATCAFGAALTAVGRTAEEVKPAEVWPVTQRPVLCPGCIRGDKLGPLVVHLNDDHRWTRERIADFVETIEATTQEVSEVATAVAEVPA